VLEVSLRKAGFSVTPAVSVGDALDKLEINAPDLIISETKFATELDGFELRRRLRAAPEWADIPFIFLTAETAIENKIKGLELGVDDYLTKPIYIKEIVTRINILLQKRQRQFLDLKKDGTRFAGRVADMPVVDVIQTIEVSRKSGVIQFHGGGNRQAAIYFRDGKVIDAEAGTLQGEDAVYRLLTWNDGEFEVEFRTVRRREAINTSSQGLLMEGMRRLDEWSRLLEQLPPLSHRFEIDAAELSTRLGEIPDDNNRILRLFDGKRTLLEVIDASDFGDLECLQAISRLYFEGLLIDLDPGVRTKRDTGKPMPLTMLDGGIPSTPIEEVVSGPIDLAAAQDNTAPKSIEPTPAQSTSPTSATPYEDVPLRARRDSGEIVADSDVLGEEEIRGPLSGGYRPSSLRLIDEAVAAAQLIEPSLFEPEELAAAGITPATASTSTEGLATAGVAPAGVAPAAAADTPLARIKIAAKTTDPRIENARDLIEKTPALREPAESAVAAATSAASPNGEPQTRRKPPTKPPPMPAAKSKLTDREIAEAPLLDADPYTSGEFKMPTEQELAAARELANAPFVDAEPYVSGEIPIPQLPEDSSGVPTAVEGEDRSELADEGPTDPSRRRFANTIRRDDSQGLRMIGSLGRDRAEASGELMPPPSRSVGAEPNEPQRELVTILPRRITREIAIQVPDEAKVQTSLATEDLEPVAPAKPEVPTGAKPAVEPPPRPSTPARRIPPDGSGVVREAGPGRGAKILIGLAAVLAGATLVSWCRKPKPVQQPVAGISDDAQVAVTPSDALEYGGFGIDASEVAVAPRADASVAVAVRPDAATVAVARDAGVRPDAATVAVTPRDAAVATSTADAGLDKTQEARKLYDKAHEALEDGDPETALGLLEESIKLRKTARSYLERARALQRLGRIDEAVTAVDEALKMNSKYAPAYEQKGMILWSAQRYADARAPLEKYLELEPNGRSAARIKAMLDEPR
jgi:DNA-binding response OmpR family regulator